MTKKEQALVDDLHHQLRLAKALSWTHAVEPDVVPPTHFKELSTGYLYVSYSGHGGDRVNEACSGSMHHSPYDKTKTTTQGARHLYSTKLRALQSMRHEVEKACAERLAAIDKQIEAELSLP